MNRAEFMARLRDLLSDITEAEREEAMNYYEDYFDDAGVENEESVIESLGSPEKVAATIKDGLNDGNGTNGEFTENGYKGKYRATVTELSKTADENGYKIYDTGEITTAVGIMTAAGSPSVRAVNSDSIIS